jgi:hypothetical protein
MKNLTLATAFCNKNTIFVSSGVNWRVGKDNMLLLKTNSFLKPKQMANVSKLRIRSRTFNIKALGDCPESHTLVSHQQQ